MSRVIYDLYVSMFGFCAGTGIRRAGGSGITTAEAAVVRHDPAVHRERVGVLRGAAACRRPAHVGDERRRLGLLGLAAELLVGERRLGLLVEHGPAGTVEEADPAAVDIAPALRLQGVRGVKQPAGRFHRFRPGGHPEEPAHRLVVPSRGRPATGGCVKTAVDRLGDRGTRGAAGHAPGARRRAGRRPRTAPARPGIAG